MVTLQQGLISKTCKRPAGKCLRRKRAARSTSECIHAHKCFQQSTQAMLCIFSVFDRHTNIVSFCLVDLIYYLTWRAVSVHFVFLLEKLIPSSSVRLSLTSAQKTKAVAVFSIFVHVHYLHRPCHGVCVPFFSVGLVRTDFPSICMTTDLCRNTLQE